MEVDTVIAATAAVTAAHGTHTIKSVVVFALGP
jgi:hypothetical protein